MADHDTDDVIWEYLQRNGRSPRLARLFRWPDQRVRCDGTSFVFEGPRVHDSYPERYQGEQMFRERPPKRRRDPITLDDVERISVYPTTGGFTGTGESRSKSVTVDIRRRNDQRTAVQFDRVIGFAVEHERALSDAIRRAAGIRWWEPPVDDPFTMLDEKRFSEWQA